MIVLESEMREFFDHLTDSEYDVVDIIHEEVENFVSNYCRRTFESTSYTKKRYDGNGETILNLDDYPLTAVDRVSINIIDVIKVKNSNDYSTASVSVTSTGLRLVLNGTADTSITFAANTTMTAVVNAINALGNNWSAELLNSTYANFKSTELVEVYGLNTIDDNWVYLFKPYEALDDFLVNLNKGQLIRRFGWPSGYQNIIIDYTAGYSSTTMPKSLKNAIKNLVQYFYNKKEEETFGISEFRVDKIFAIFERGNIPKEIKMVLNMYQRKRT